MKAKEVAELILEVMEIKKLKGDTDDFQKREAP